MSKPLAAHFQGIAIGLVAGASMVINFGGQALYALGAISLALGTVAYGLEKRGEE